MSSIRCTKSEARLAFFPIKRMGANRIRRERRLFRKVDAIMRMNKRPLTDPILDRLYGMPERNQ